jgi:hypothetical protein
LIKLGHVDFVIDVEGDDDFNSSTCNNFPTAADYAKYGFVAKVVVDEDLAAHSFCGGVYTQDGEVIVDPIRTILRFGWTDGKYAKAKLKVKRRLLLSKALSYAFQYPYCPIVRDMCEYVFRMLPNQKASLDDVYTESDPRRQYLDSDFTIANFRQQFPYHVSQSSRALMEKIFGVGANQQKMIEEYFQKKNDFSSWWIPGLELSADARDYWDECSSQDPNGQIREAGPDPAFIKALVNWAGAPHHRGRVRVVDWQRLIIELDGKTHKPTWKTFSKCKFSAAHDVEVMRMRGQCA